MISGIDMSKTTGRNKGGFLVHKANTQAVYNPNFGYIQQNLKVGMAEMNKNLSR